MIVINILLIQAILCFIIDLSGFIQSLESGLSKLLKFKVSIPKPFSCSLCSGFWINLLFLLITGNFTIPYIAIVSAVSFFSKTISGTLLWIQEFFIHLLDILNRWIR